MVRFGLEGAPPLIRSVNPAFKEEFGEENPVVGNSLPDFLDNFETEVDLTVLIDRITAGEEIDIEIRDASGGPQYFRIRSITNDEMSVGWLLFSDVTDYKQRHHELEHQNELVEEFVGIISHDLRNPLDVAKARLEAARESGEDVHFEKIAHAHERMEQIIQGVLTLARQGKIVNEMDSVELGAVVEDAWATVETADGSLEIVDELPLIRADPERLQQLLENLFRNAIEHGGATVTVRVGTISNGFYVANDGPNIPETDRERVFEPGFSTNDSTGLGLAIVERIADAHGWRVGVMSADTGGVRFTFTGIEGWNDGNS